MTSILAHRGRRSTAWAENTVESSNALPVWVTGVEGDPRLSADDIPVMMHDETVDRTTDGTGRVDELTAAQITDLTVTDGTEGHGKVPTLEAWLLAQSGKGREWIYLDVKETDVASISAMMAVVDAAPADVRSVVTWLCAGDPAAVNVRSVSATARIARRGANLVNIDTVMAEMDAIDGILITTDPDKYLENRGIVPILHDAGYFAGAGRINDEAEQIAARLDGVDVMSTDNAELLSDWGDPVTPPTYSAAFIASLVSGSHRAVIEARVLTEYQSGDDPDGETIPPLGGRIDYDATADVWATGNLTTAGFDEADWSPRFPRRADQLLAPYGNEVFLRRGIDTGDEVLFVPLGYFRIDGARESPTSDAPITLALTDRMQGLRDAQLISPRQYSATSTIAAVVYDLTIDVYPDIVVIWDDDTEQLPLDRSLVVERNRYAALRDIADAHGKVMYFDSFGYLRFEGPPDPTDPDWELAAGENGVLIDSDREVSRDGICNAVVATGQGAGSAAIRAVAVDIGPDSPTRYGGRFGKKPDFYTSSLITDSSQALAAATARLRRYIGATYSASFGTIPNPAARPFQVARIGQKNGDRELHMLETLTIPLDTKAKMTGTTREQTLAHIGSLVSSAGAGLIETDLG